MKYYLGAYAASPNQQTWDSQLEATFYQELKSLDNLRGLEHPFLGKLHIHDENWFLNTISPNWDFVFTCIPGIMNALAQNPHFGLASNDEVGRKAALRFMQHANLAILKLNKHLGRQAVKAIQIQTAPARDKANSSKEALLNSLNEMLSWDWHGTRLVIEHCDAYMPAHTPSKGFLSLDDEISVLRSLNLAYENVNLGLVINWGRSVFETRSATGALNHIEQAKNAGLLAGLMFSGVSDKDSEFGAWKDNHQPARKSDKVHFGEAQSLMTEEAMHECLAACDNGALLDVLGVKIGIRPQSADIALRMNYIRDTFGILDRFFKQ